MSGNREAVRDFDAAVDQAMSSLGEPPEADESASDGGRDASEPTAPQLRAVPEQDQPAGDGEPDQGAELARQRIEREEQQRQQAQQGDVDRHAVRGRKYADFLDDIENNAGLRDYIRGYWEQQQRGQPAAPQQAQQGDDDPLEGYDDRDRAALNKLWEQRERRILSQMEQMLKPFHEQAAQHAAEREYAALAKEYPDWEQHASRQDLAGIRQQFPDVSLIGAFRMAAFDRVRAKNAKTDRQLAKVGDVINRRPPAESQPRRHVKVDKREMSWDEAFDKAWSQAKAAFGTPGR